MVGSAYKSDTCKNPRLLMEGRIILIKDKEISMKFHPRAFAAFGSDLVTNDSVAITELVKNCYDAYANNAVVVFGSDTQTGDYIEIADDGLGMTQEVVKTAWAMIATPYKKNHPFVEKNGNYRMVSGNKGLGRFSAARLGRKMIIRTLNENDYCFSVMIDWDAFEKADSIEDCKVLLEEYDSTDFLQDLSGYFSEQAQSGTIIRIYELNTLWDEAKIELLKSSLSRLISPFDKVDDFSISLFQKSSEMSIKIEPHAFIKNPVYCISGNVDKSGTITWKYRYAPKKEVIKCKEGTIKWEEAYRGFDRSIRVTDDNENIKPYSCGPFSYEIRAWDLDSESIGDLHDTFNIQKREIRQTISRYKGISVYRDNVLVLPKSDSSKDWLGIDVRRISAIGKRLSTSQMVGILSISQKDNPELKDTTDREKLVDTEEYKQFCRAAESVISVLENNRNIDKRQNSPIKYPTLTDLLSPLSPTALESKVELMIKNGSNSEEILDIIHEYSADTENSLNELNDRLIYYAQAASLGSISVVIMHEIRTGMTAIKRFLNRIRGYKDLLDDRTTEYLEDSENSHARLLAVADSFAPLYRKGLSKEKNSVNVLEAVNNSVRLISAKKEAKNISFDIEVDPNYTASMHTGELQTIFINLLDNACYWLKKVEGEKKIKIQLTNRKKNKIEIRVSDNGPGVLIDEKQKIFSPGITAKPNGIGMGLVIVTELLSKHENTIRLETPGDLGGATFVFTLT